MRVAVAKIEPFQESLFAKSFIRLDKTTLTLEILEADNSELQEEIQLLGKLRSVDTQLTNSLVDGYQIRFEKTQLSAENELNLPDDEFQFPLALTFTEGEILLLWAPSEEEHWRWTSGLKLLMLGQPDDETNQGFLVRSSENSFTANLYRCLKRRNKNSEPAQKSVETREAATVSVPLAEEESKEAVLETAFIPGGLYEGPKMMAGWMLRTHGPILDSKQEAWLQRYYRFDSTTSILSEHQDENKSRKLLEIVLHRKIAWVETNLAN